MDQIVYIKNPKICLSHVGSCSRRGFERVEGFLEGDSVVVVVDDGVRKVWSYWGVSTYDDHKCCLVFQVWKWKLN